MDIYESRQEIEFKKAVKRYYELQLLQENGIIKEWDEEAHPRDENGRFTSGGVNRSDGREKLPKDSSGTSKRPRAGNLSEKEASKVKHDINNVYHARYKGKRVGKITTYNPDDDKAYNYTFECYGFGNYNIFRKVENKD